MSKMKFRDILIANDGIVKGPFGGDIKKAYFVPKAENTYKVYEQGVVYSKDCSYGTYYIDSTRYEKLKRFSISTGDILITGAGTLGELYVIPVKHEEGVINQALIRIRLDENVIDKDFFLFYFKWYLKNIVCRINGDSVIPNLPPLNILKEMDIDIPDIRYQKQVGKVLKVIDDKIESNIKINTELESMAKTIYDYWFLQFEFPNEEGKPYKSSGGKMVWNEELKREIPEGWKVVRIGDLFTSSRGISYNSKVLEKNGIPMINLASFKPGGGYKVEGIKNYSGNYEAEKILKPYDLVMCNTQQTAIDFSKDIIGKVFLVPDIFDSDIVSSHHVTKLSVKSEVLKYYLYRLFCTDYFHKYIAGFTNGTNILGLLFNGVEDYRNEIPDEKVLQKFALIISNIEQKKNEIIKENQELASLRDFLLPLLMNGQIGFKDC